MISLSEEWVPLGMLRAPDEKSGFLFGWVSGGPMQTYSLSVSFHSRDSWNLQNVHFVAKAWHEWLVLLCFPGRCLTADVCRSWVGVPRYSPERKEQSGPDRQRGEILNSSWVLDSVAFVVMATVWQPSGRQSLCLSPGELTPGINLTSCSRSKLGVLLFPT